VGCIFDPLLPWTVHGEAVSTVEGKRTLSKLNPDKGPTRIGNVTVFVIRRRIEVLGASWG
jgi:hypothetical protein